MISYSWKEDEKMTDFHAHILPGADHGCGSMRTCESQLKWAQRYGISTIVATSHFYPHLHDVDAFLKKRDAAFEKASECFSKYGIDVLKGAEVQLCIGLDKMPGIEKLCVENTKVLLIEIPDMPMTEEMYDTLKNLSESFFVLIAHVDRYSSHLVRRLCMEKYMFQINADSLFGFKNRKRTKEILKTGLVHAIGSDIHGSDRFGYALMKKARNLLKEQYESIEDKMRCLLGR